MRFGLREMIFILVLLAMPVAAYFFVFQPRNVQIADAKREIEQKQEKLRQLETSTRTISDLGREIDKLTGAITEFEHRLPPQREVDVILKQVWELADKHRLVAKSIRTDKPVTTAQYSELPIKIVIAGGFDGFYEFIRDLEKLRRITQVPRLTLKKGGTEEGQVQAELTLSIFFDLDETVPARDGERSRL